MIMVMECRLSDLSAEPLIFIKSSKKNIADFFGTEDTILYAACFDANGGVFEPSTD